MTRRFLLVVNPKSGNRKWRRLIKEVVSRFSEEGIETKVAITEGIGHATDIARSGDLTKYEAVCVQGGDGTVQEFLNGLLRRSDGFVVPLGLIAGGTGNSIHHQLGLNDLNHSITKMIVGHSQPVDILQVTSGDDAVCCVNLVGWASVARIARRAEKMRCFGPLRYSLAALVEIAMAQRIEGKLGLSGRELEGRFFLVIACNTQRVGSGMLMAPRASVQDGLMDIVIVRDASRMQMLELFRRVHTGSHLELPFVEYYRVAHLDLSVSVPVSVNLDGNVSLDERQRFSVDVMPGAATVFF